MSEGRSAIAQLVVEIDRYLGRFELAGARKAREGVARWGRSATGNFAPQWLLACSHLDGALDAMDDAPLAHAIAEAAPNLRWITYDAYPRAEIGENFATGHAFASVIGGDAPVVAEDFDLGLFLIAPNTLYRDHHHRAPELYAPLTGPHGWRFGPGDPFISRNAHDPVWNEPFRPHATLTGDVPFLCIFCWASDVNHPARVIPAADWGDYET